MSAVNPMELLGQACAFPLEVQSIAGLLVDLSVGHQSNAFVVAVLPLLAV